MNASDLRLVGVSLWRSRGTSLLIVAALGVGFALAAVAFTFSTEILHGSLGGSDADRVVMIRERLNRRGVNIDLPAADLVLRRAARASFDGFGAWYGRTRDFKSDGVGEGLLDVTYLTSDAFGIVGAGPQLGSIPADGRVSGARAVVLAADTWRTRFGADPAVVGKKLMLGGELHVVAGVMPEGFGFPIRQDAWVLLDWADLPRASAARFQFFGRLRTGLSAAQGAAEIQSLPGRARNAGYQDSDLRVEVLPFTRGFLDPEMDPVIWGAVFALAVVVLVAASNVASLMLARAAQRTQELSVRAALGASRGRLVSMVLTEAAVLVGLSAASGLLLARVVLELAAARILDQPYWMSLELRPLTFVFVALLALAATAFAGLGPAIRAARAASSAQWLRAGSGLSFARSSRRLVAAELALSLGLLTVAVTLARGALAFGEASRPLGAERIALVQVFLQGGGIDTADARRVAIEGALGSLPGVTTIASAEHFPGNDELRPTELEIEHGADPARIRAMRAEIGPRYFDVLGASVLRGRAIEEPDQRQGEAVAVVNESFAKRNFGASDPLGSRIRDVVTTTSGEVLGPWRTIVGVVKDLGLNPGDPRRGASIYVPLHGSRFFRSGLLVDGSPTALTSLIYETLQRVDRDAHVQSVSTIAEQFAMSRLFVSALATIATLAGGLGLALALASTFAQLSLAVTMRTREIGIRAALGGARMDVLRGVVLKEAAPAWFGTMSGVILGAALARVTTILPVQVESAGGGLMGAMVALALLGTAIACLKPALRAVAVDPAVALRHD